MNSFGYGGANVYVVMDDAFHYVKERGLTANHPTVPSTKQFPRTYSTSPYSTVKCVTRSSASYANSEGCKANSTTRSPATSLAGKTEPNAFVKTVIHFK